MISNQDKKCIHKCIELSEEAISQGDNPFGCVIASQKKIIVEATNNIRNCDVTQHAEIVAMRKAQKLLNTDDLSGYSLYSNCEPCPMCSFVIRELKISRVVYALRSYHMGGLNKWNILKDKDLKNFESVFSQAPEVVEGVLADEALKVMNQAGWTVFK